MSRRIAPPRTLPGSRSAASIGKGGRSTHVTLYAPRTPVSCRAMSVAIVGSTVRDVVYLPGSRAHAQPGRLADLRGACARGARRAARQSRPAATTPRSPRRSPSSPTPLCLRIDDDGHAERAALPRGRRARPHAREHRRRLERGRHRRLGRARAARARPGSTPARSAAATSGPRCWPRSRRAGAASRSTRRGRCGCRRSGRSCSSGALDAALLQHVQALKLSEEEALRRLRHDRRRPRSATHCERARDPRHVRLPGRGDRVRRAARATSRPTR